MAITRLGGANAITGTLPAANINNTSIGNVTSLPAAISTGKAIQVVTSTTGTNTQITTQSDTDTSLSASITPTSSSNKVLVLVSQMVQFQRDAGSGYEMAATTKLFRDSSQISKKTSSITVGSGPTGTQGGRDGLAFAVLDSPSTTSSVTYKTTGSCNTTNNNGTIRYNEGGTKGEITLIEVAS